MSGAKPQDAIGYYDAVAQEFHESYEYDRNRLERLEIWRNALDRHVPRAELGYDLGCGSGMLTFELATRAVSVVGIDGSREMLDIAQRVALQKNLTNVSCLQMRLPPKSDPGLASGDVVISSSALEYFDSLEEALRFAHSLLTPGGMLLFSVSNRDSVSRKLVRIVHRVTGRPRYFGLVRHFMNEREIGALLENAGFVSVETIFFGGRDIFNMALGTLLPQRFSTNMILSVARCAA